MMRRPRTSTLFPTTPLFRSRDIVAEELDLSAILSAYTEPRGYPPYHPAMMVALLLYAYSRGLYSSRRIARACEERLDFQAVAALNRPDFRTISEFRRRHLAALADLFVQVLALCRRAGLVGLGHVALDGRSEEHTSELQSRQYLGCRLLLVRKNIVT